MTKKTEVKEKAELTKKRAYEKPEIESEDLLTFGALCNGSTAGGRKSATGAPNFCNSKKLTS